MSERKKKLINTIVIVFMLMCCGQWFFAEREDWPFTYFGMYKKRIRPNNIFSFKMWAYTKDNVKIDAYSLGSFNFYSFNDEVEKIFRDRYITRENVEVQASDTLLLDEDRLSRLKALLQQDWEPHLAQLGATAKINSYELEVRYWKLFKWEDRNNPDTYKRLILAAYHNGKWQYQLSQITH